MGGKIMCFGVEPVQEKNGYTKSDTPHAMETGATADGNLTFMYLKGCL